MNILLITSTIVPSENVFMLMHNDPIRRLQEYISAFRFYIKLLNTDFIDRLVYVDNSGFDLSELREIAEESGLSDRCEFISFLTKPSSDVSRYFLEVNLLKEAISRSKFITETNAYIWKVTGRYKILNCMKIIQSCPKNADIYINCRNYPYKTVDFYFLRFTKGAFEQLLAANLDEFRTHLNGEDILRRRIDENTSMGLTIVPRLNVTPQIVGIRGYDGARYGGVKDFAKFIARYSLNNVLPKIWV